MVLPLRGTGRMLAALNLGHFDVMLNASDDGGVNWYEVAAPAYMPLDQAGDPNTQDPHAIVRCAARPEVLWCQHHNGIWRSTDDAAS